MMLSGDLINFHVASVMERMEILPCKYINRKKISDLLCEYLS